MGVRAFKLMSQHFSTQLQLILLSIHHLSHFAYHFWLDQARFYVDLIRQHRTPISPSNNKKSNRQEKEPSYPSDVPNRKYPSDDRR
jgi:hypothetical protein